MNKTQIFHFFGGIVAVTLTACAGFGTETRIGTTTINNFGGGQVSVEQKAEAAKPVNQTVVATSSRKSEVRKVVVLNNRRDLLRVKLIAEGTDNDAKVFANEINSMISGALSENTAKVVTGENADVLITVRPKLEEYDKAGEYYRMNVSVYLEAKDISGTRILGTNKVQVNGKRTLGRDKAVSELAGPASKESAEWCDKLVKDIFDKEIDVAILKIRLPGRVTNGARDASKDNEKNEIIAKEIAKFRGVVSYGYVGYDSAEGTVEYRLVYLKESYPSGIAGAVGALLNTNTELK